MAEIRLIAEGEKSHELSSALQSVFADVAKTNYWRAVGFCGCLSCGFLAMGFLSGLITLNTTPAAQSASLTHAGGPAAPLATCHTGDSRDTPTESQVPELRPVKPAPASGLVPAPAPVGNIR